MQSSAEGLNAEGRAVGRSSQLKLFPLYGSLAVALQITVYISIFKCDSNAFFILLPMRVAKDRPASSSGALRGVVSARLPRDVALLFLHRRFDFVTSDMPFLMIAFFCEMPAARFHCFYKQCTNKLGLACRTQVLFRDERSTGSP